MRRLAFWPIGSNRDAGRAARPFGCETGGVGMARKSFLPKVVPRVVSRLGASHQHFTPLRRKLPVPIWGDLMMRLSAVLLLIMIVVMIHWLDRDGLQDSY